ncbi:NAD(P)H-binding protein [soil metagenome]
MRVNAFGCHTAQPIADWNAMVMTRRVLVLGASGMVGRAIRAEARGAEELELLPASHRRLAGHVRIDYASLTTPEAWVSALTGQRIDAVVNCVGIWSGTAQEFELLQYTVPVALFDACNELGARVVHVSALGFSADSPLPYASTKARADRYLLDHCASGVVIYPSLIFGSDGDSSQFFLDLAALPIHVDFGFARNLQPVHVREVAQVIVGALRQQAPPHTIDCVGTHCVNIPEYFDALRAGMGLKPALLRLKLPRWCGRLLFQAGEVLGAHFVNRQTWILLATGTHGSAKNPAALPYEKFATAADRRVTQETQLYWFARLGIAFLWLWTAAVTYFSWPQQETLSWLDSLWPGLGTPFWLAASCVLDAALGTASLLWPRKRLWQVQFALTAVYSVGLAVALPWSWSHPFGPLTKNLAVLATMLFLALQESKKGR